MSKTTQTYNIFSIKFHLKFNCEKKTKILTISFCFMPDNNDDNVGDQLPKHPLPHTHKHTDDIKVKFCQ